MTDTWGQDSWNPLSPAFRDRMTSDLAAGIPQYIEPVAPDPGAALEAFRSRPQDNFQAMTDYMARNYEPPIARWAVAAGSCEQPGGH